MKKELSARPSQVSCVYGPPLLLHQLSKERKIQLTERAALRENKEFRSAEFPIK